MPKQRARRRHQRRPVLRTTILFFLILFTLDRYQRCNPYVCTPNTPLHLDPDLDGYPTYRAHLASHPPPRPHPSDPDRVLVVASLRSENTSWVDRHFSDWQRAVYTMDDWRSRYYVPENKGREAMAYLTYIIDHWEYLPSIMVFSHAQRWQWHNEDPRWDGVPPIKSLRPSYVQRHGFANLRCTWELGCPAEVHPHRPLSRVKAALFPTWPPYNLDASYAQAWLELFPHAHPRDVPLVVGAHCGAQFALSRDAVRSLPLSRWKHLRAWLLATTLDDSISGRMMEYTWHQILGKPAVNCPSAQDCFCEKFGLCGLKCPDEARCAKRYKHPVITQFPKGWPHGPRTWFGWPDQDWALKRDF